MEYDKDDKALEVWTGQRAFQMRGKDAIGLLLSMKLKWKLSKEPDAVIWEKKKPQWLQDPK